MCTGEGAEVLLKLCGELQDHGVGRAHKEHPKLQGRDIGAAGQGRKRSRLPLLHDFPDPSQAYCTYLMSSTLVCGIIEHKLLLYMEIPEVIGSGPPALHNSVCFSVRRRIHLSRLTLCQMVP